MARKRFQFGSLFKRGKRLRVWVGRWWEDVMQDGLLRRVRRSIVLGTLTELPTRAKAQNALSERLRPINSGTHRLWSSNTLHDFVSLEWEPVELPTLKYATQIFYRHLIHVHILPAFGAYRLADMSREAIQTFLNQKLEKGLSWKTVYHLRGAIRRVLSSAVSWDYLADNPVRKTKLPRRPRGKEQAVLAPADIQKLVPVLPEPTRTIVLLLVVTGLRIGELLALRWRRVNLEARELEVRETYYKGRFDEPKTKRSARRIPIGEYTAAILRELRPANVNPDALIFANRLGNPLNRRNLLRRHLQATCKTLGLPRITWHALRHSNASLLDAVGAPLGTVQSLLGHASSEVTSGIYLHGLPEEERRAVTNVEKLVFGPKWTQVLESSESGERVSH